VEPSETHSHAPGSERDTGRVEAFSDGVFAIAITLLILEIKVPRPEDSATADLASALLSLWPSYFAYTLSFVTIGIYWARHHYIFKLYQRTNHILNLLNLNLLLWISFLPFPTAVLATYIRDRQNQKTAAIFYAIALLLPAASWMLMWLYASWRRRLIDPHLEAGFLRRLTMQYLASVALYLGAVLVSLIDFKMGLMVCIGLTLLYLLPPKNPVYVRSAGDTRRASA
jgi:uncharacterized membrane protein